MSLKDRVSRAITRFFSPRADTQAALRDLGSCLVDAIESSPGIEGPQQVRIHRLDKDLPLPSQSNPYDAGWDVYAAKDVELKGGQSALVPLGIIVEAPENYHFQLHIRSSMAYKNHCRLENSVGIIDSTYCGEKDECKALVKYEGSPKTSYKISKGDRIAQLVLVQNQQITWAEQESAGFSGQSRGGYGSTGR